MLWAHIVMVTLSLMVVKSTHVVDGYMDLIGCWCQSDLFL